MKIVVRQVKKGDLEGCCVVELRCFAPEEAASRARIKRRIELFPQGFLVAVAEKQVIGMVNCASTDKEDISYEKLKSMVGHVDGGKNLAVFSLAVLPEFQKKGISKMLMNKFIKAAKKLKKEKILLICKEDMIPYYQKYGFAYDGKSKSKHGGSEWHNMSLRLQGKMQ